MMHFTPEEVERYLTIVNDKNPVHAKVVPGQMIVQSVFITLNINWSAYRIKYIESIYVYEEFKVEFLEKDKIIVSNIQGKLKFQIINKKDDGM